MVSMSHAPADRQSPAGSQTLDRGLRALEILAETERPMSIGDLAAALEIHRSSAYRILRTLESHRLVLRDEAGLIRLGPRLVTLARGAAPRLNELALPEITELANRFGVTAFVGVLDGDQVITLISVEPAQSHSSVSRRPGARHSVRIGATGHAIEASLTVREHAAIFGGEPLSCPAHETLVRGYARSQNEVVPGLTGLAVPLRVEGEPPASLAIVQIGDLTPDDEQSIVGQLHRAAARITGAPHSALSSSPL